MTPRRIFTPPVAKLLVLAAGACAAIYYGAVPWALGHAVAATLSLLGYR